MFQAAFCPRHVFLCVSGKTQLWDASETQILRSTRCDVTVHTDLKMHVPGNILLSSCFVDRFQEHEFTGCSLDPGLEVHLLRFYIEFLFEYACSRQRFVNVVFLNMLPDKKHLQDAS